MIIKEYFKTEMVNLYEVEILPDMDLLREVLLLDYDFEQKSLVVARFLNINYGEYLMFSNALFPNVTRIVKPAHYQYPTLYWKKGKEVQALVRFLNMNIELWKTERRINNDSYS